ncbi:diguanylate cyclase [Rhizobium sp. TRM95111]|uniref:GGDEF domain-containing response regulator n=1 Tax=Rhizobium alarense TaxID=2846851 RepID=UPI001F1DC630|nr:diguanylate cyclase [Rhizobium alarense]MCF3640509.1 diguanylate cyclase [Rhizobium alarense]
MFSTAIRYRLEQELGLSVTHCGDMTSLRQLLEGTTDFAIAVLDLNLPGAPNGEALDYILDKGIPPLVFTGAFNGTTRETVLAKNVLDFVLKDNPSAIQQLVVAVDKILSGGRTSVLAVSSSDEARAELVSLLRAQQFSVCEAGNGAAALSLLDCTEQPDMVVTDLRLADMDGLELLATIRQCHGDERIRVVGVCDDPDRIVAARFLRAGGDEFIQKPFLVEEFNSRIQHLAAIQKRVQELQHIAARDFLTDIYNRRYFFEAGQRLVDQSLRRGETVAIAILDIDHFKRLNDTYGHEVGDTVLKVVARRLKARIGDRFLLARLGGEEFGVIFQGVDLDHALEESEGLREQLAAEPIDADGEPLTITVSIGLAEISGRETFDNYLNAADQFLYMAKHAGRNRVFSELSLMTALAV